jgi:hypothetical protein
MRKIGRNSKLKAATNDLFSEVGQALVIVKCAAYVTAVAPDESEYLYSALSQSVKSAYIAVQELSALNGKDRSKIFDAENMLIGVIKSL